MPKKRTVLLLSILLLLWLHGTATAQGIDQPTDVIEWRELNTDTFVIVYAERVTFQGQEIPCACGVAEAERYATFIDRIYGDLVAIFGTPLESPLSLQLFPTERSYYAVNPLAERLSGVIAHALNNQREIAIAVPRTKDLTEEELVNNIRHELTHLFVSFLSEGEVTAGFQEGIAQYVERPTDRSDYDPALLRVAQEEGRLLTWAELDDPARVYGDPQVAYPQTRSIIAFLVDRYGFPSLLDFVRAAAAEPGYRSALESVYETSADELEAAWLAYLPEYFARRWQINALYAYDLGRVTQLVEQGAYTSVLTELEEIIALLETTDQQDTLAEAESLLARALQGRTAGRLADQARQALQSNEYARTIELGTAAIAAYEKTGLRERLPELEIYLHRARTGQQALQQLQRGAGLIDALRFGEAEMSVQQATTVLQSLGDQPAAERGVQLLQASASRQRGLAYGLLAAGLATLFFNFLRRGLDRLRPNLQEAEL